MKKRILCLLAALTILSANAYGADIAVEGEVISSQPVIVNSRVLVPVRGVFEKLGFEVAWLENSKTAVLTNDSLTITLKNGDKGFRVNSKTVTPDVPQQIIENRFYLPLRAVVDILPEYNIDWAAAEKRVYITKINSASSTNNTAGSYAQLEKEVLKLVNDERRAQGLGELTWSDDLAEIAREHSQNMAQNDFVSHEAPDGTDPFDRLAEAGIHYGCAAENIAAGSRTEEAVMKQWMNSTGHRKNILNKEIKKIGIGLATSEDSTYGYYWTQVFTD